jgi:4-hydroxy-3-methylbut-2-enyl diphosphate reductase
MAPKADAMLVIGAPNSSNSKRLVEVGARAGCRLCAAGAARDRYRLARAGRHRARIGITAGASAPEVLVNEVIDAFRDRYDVTVEPGRDRAGNVEFKVPRVLRAGASNRGARSSRAGSSPGAAR